MATLHRGCLLVFIFPTAFVLFMSLCHSLVLFAIFQTFSLLLYFLWWSVISDLWHCYCNCFGALRTMPTWDGQLNECVCSDCSTNQPSLISLPISWDTTILLLGQLITLQWPIGVFEWKEELHNSYFKSKARNNYKLSEEGMLKAKIGWKLDLSAT